MRTITHFSSYALFMLLILLPAPLQATYRSHYAGTACEADFEDLRPTSLGGIITVFNLLAYDRKDDIYAYTDGLRGGERISIELERTPFNLALADQTSPIWAIYRMPLGSPETLEVRVATARNGRCTVILKGSASVDAVRHSVLFEYYMDLKYYDHTQGRPRDIPPESYGREIWMEKGPFMKALHHEIARHSH